MNDLMAMLGGAAPAAPLPSSPDLGLDPLAGGPMGADPMAAMAPVGPQFPSADPMAVGSMLEQLLMMQEQDQMALKDAQSAALVGNPLFQALVSGAPVGPGAGQDAQAIGPAGDIAPDEMLPV